MGTRAASLIALCLAAHGIAETRPGCEALPGAETLWSRPNLRFVLAGEMHGCAETPAIFRDLVCAASSSGRPVVVGLERRASEQAALDAFMAPANHKAATNALLEQRGWNTFDGRSSRAMLALLEDLRVLKLSGRISEVVAFDARADGTDPQREQGMASALIAAADRNANSLVLVLTGNLHASKKLVEGFGAYPFMAMLLPAGQTVSLFVADEGGEFWNCQGGACCPHKQGASGGTKRGLVLSRSAPPGFDGVLSTGLAATASPPAVEDGPPEPAGTKK